MDINGTYRGFAPTFTPLAYHEIKMVVDNERICFHIADNERVEAFSIPRGETRVMTTEEIAALFQEGVNLKEAYGLSLGDESEDVILLWQPPALGYDGPRVVKRNKVEDELSYILRWVLFDTDQVAAGSLEAFAATLTNIDTGDEEIRIVRLPVTK